MRDGVYVSVGALAIAGCASIMTRPDYLKATLAPRASFDLGCPADKLEYADLGAPLDNYQMNGDKAVYVRAMAEQQGVSGCGKRATYVMAGHQWVMNNDSGPKSGGGN